MLTPLPAETDLPPQIGDLLAAISGDAAKSTSPGPKRKAEDDLRGSAVKKAAALPNGSSRPSTDSSGSLPRLPAKSSTVVNSRPGLVSRPTANSDNAGLKKNLSTPAKTGSAPKTTSTGKSLSTSATGSRSQSSEAPKKGSFAEIMARAKAAQDVRMSLGKIQHKTIERGMTMKERKEMRAEESRTVRKGAKPTTSKWKMEQQGKLPPRNGSSGLSTSRAGAGNGSLSKAAPTARPPKKAPVVEEKKVKKAATATTGYTGTARPRPSANKSGASSSRPGSDSKSDARPRYGGALAPPRRRRDDYDEDLDDFIEYDDEEEEPGYGRGRGYDSMEEDESDMEAGMSDIDEEERHADFHARREDQEQEALERRLKREKEERKRHFSRNAGR